MNNGSKLKLEMKPSSTSTNLAVKAAIEELESQKSPSLRESYEALMSQLEIDGIPKDQVSTVGQKIIIEQKRSILEKQGYHEEELKNITISSWWFEVARENNYVNTFYARNTKLDTEPYQNNSSINTKNKRMILLLSEGMDVFRESINKFKEMDEIHELFGEKQTKEFYSQMETILSNCKYAFDDKTKVPINTEHLLLEFLATAGSLSYAGQIFLKSKIEHLGVQIKYLTPKQGTKFQKGEKQSKLPLFQPDTRDTAIYMGYYGIQCECKSWRIRRKSDSNALECFDCDAIFHAKTISKCSYCQIPLYKERLLHIAKTKRCEDCNTEIDLPQELIDYANS